MLSEVRAHPCWLCSILSQGVVRFRLNHSRPIYFLACFEGWLGCLQKKNIRAHYSREAFLWSVQLSWIGYLTSSDTSLVAFLCIQSVSAWNNLIQSELQSLSWSDLCCASLQEQHAMEICVSTEIWSKSITKCYHIDYRNHSMLHN